MLYWNTVTPLLREVLECCMQSSTFKDFRLVGGTALSLQLGHRISVDIDLFTDALYETVDFEAIDHFFRSTYRYVDTYDTTIIGMGKTYLIGNAANDAVKVDVYYTEPFIQPPKTAQGIILATIDDIVPMKLEVIGRSGRKKDFWDLHACYDRYSIADMIDLYLKKYAYNFTEAEIREGLANFSQADDDLDPRCLYGKHWELIKYDFSKWLSA